MLYINGTRGPAGTGWPRKAYLLGYKGSQQDHNCQKKENIPKCEGSEVLEVCRREKKLGKTVDIETSEKLTTLALSGVNNSDRDKASASWRL